MLINLFISFMFKNAANFLKQSTLHLRICLLSYTTSNNKVMRVLNVAEKNDVAKNLALFLSGGNLRKREGFSVFNKIYEFEYPLRGQRQLMVMTSVSGHLLNYAFNGNYKKWTACSPASLFDAPVSKCCPDNYEKIKQTLEREIRSCEMLIIWTDCDREGENIGFEIISVCQAVKRNIQIYRAKFSEITAQSARRAMETLDRPNKLISEAVDVRSELDLRIGAAFTRFQTLRLTKVFPTVLSDSIISYGSCQFPTLGFVVERYKAIESFIPERFWKIKVEHTIGDLTVEFNWKRVRLFDRLMCQVLYDKCLENMTATVVNIMSKPKSKWRPLPLDTVELEKLASRRLRMNAKETMSIAEKLYTKGFISYPRTETNIFPKELNLANLVQMQTNNNFWGEFANRVLQDGPNPRQGRKTDQAHPPIHPTKCADLRGNEAKVYELIVRHFLACVSKDALGHETIVDIDINGEKFTANGLLILERNYLDVYPYENWNSKEIHMYQMRQTFQPTSLEIADGVTSPPKLLTEADLIALMEKHGIGTDATHAEHIDKIKFRNYVGLEDEKYFVPGHLGIGLVEGYDSMGFPMSKPNLRAELEADLKRICDGEKAAAEVLAEQIQKYREVFRLAQEQANKLDTALSRYLNADPETVREEPTMNQTVMKCAGCNSDIILSKRPNASYCLRCLGYPRCKMSMWFPASVLEVEVTQESCRDCGPGVKKLQFKCRPGTLSPSYPNTYIGCVNGCDEQLLELLSLRSFASQLNSRTAEDRPAPVTAVRNSQSSHSSSGYSSMSGGNSSRNNSWPTSASFQSDNSTSVQRNQQNQHSWNRPNNSFSMSDNNRQNNNQWSANSSNQNTGGSADEYYCVCGEPARKLTVTKDSVNKGRQFYTCAKGRENGCNFFLWADDNNTGNGGGWGGGDGPSGGGGGGRGQGSFRAPQYRGMGRGDEPNTPKKGKKRPASTQGTRKCSVCFQPGHTRNKCPQL